MSFQDGSSVVDQMTRLRLKLLEKRLEIEKHNMDDRADSAHSARSYDGRLDALQGALRRKQGLLQRLRLPQQPATIIQLPQQHPLITQIPPPQPYPAARSGSIKEDMVELMLMQNAQMHQIIMHNMMLKAIPPMALFQTRGPSLHAPHVQQDSYQGNPILLRPDLRPRGGAVHHHHYGTKPVATQLPPINYPTLSSVPAGQTGGHPSSLHHMTSPITLPPLNMTQTSL
ncbi:hypothetical protein JOB18_047696 [Solea senegalensis]|uniref:DUF4587 domain-containing protein n=1 Tax=Solea senegalensis TaxID=28829 RepID=A0AAV6S1R8_SOLSE|nr:uncharacterized protein C21orf58 isoform X3 [Solea senegalensis]KAG7511356.1 hypothetical protein JOB18_047696 [Solea senegalensis]